jgi:hypothetical protein
VKHQGKEILINEGVFTKEAILHRRDSQTVETTDIVGPNIEIRQGRSSLGLPDADRLEVYSEGTHQGDLVRNPTDEHFEFKPDHEKG